MQAQQAAAQQEVQKNQAKTQAEAQLEQTKNTQTRAVRLFGWVLATD